MEYQDLVNENKYLQQEMIKVQKAIRSQNEVIYRLVTAFDGSFYEQKLREAFEQDDDSFSASS